ncbi:MAG: elongation factor EF-2 [Candidatus Woesearchaeota archaeon]
MHGKCIAPDSRLILRDGTMLTAKKLFNLAEKKGTKFEETKDHIIYDTNSLNLEAFSLNKTNGKLEKKPIQLAWKLKGGDLINIKLRNNFNISTTPEHKYLVLENLEFTEKEAKDIKLGDRIICPRKLETNSNINIKRTILLKLAEKRFYVKVNKILGEKIKKFVLKEKETIKKINKEIKYKSFYHGSWQNRYLLKDLIEISSLININLEYLYNNIETIIYRSGAQRGKSSLPTKLPQNFQNFYYLAGLFVGDGHHKKFIVGKNELKSKFVEICNELGINVTYRNYEYRTEEIVTNATLLEILNSLFDYPKVKKSHNVKISEFLLLSPKKYSSKFLRGYFDTDGCVEKSRRAVTISSASDKMIADLSMFLLRFGCIPIIEKDNTITISGQSMINFIAEIGFEIKAKIAKANSIKQTIIGSMVSDVIPVTHSNGMISLQKNFTNSEKLINFCEKNDISIENISKILSKDISYIEVKAIETKNEEFVYDFTVKDNHNFAAEGMIIHNTTFSDNLLAGAGMISKELAGKQLALDFHEDEATRGITIDSASVSMLHTVKGEDYLINLIDTPGHVDFGGDVTRAMRAVDGAIVLVDAVEGIMPQTETVLKQALREMVKPVLFINKVDRLIKEVKLTPQAMQERFIKIISDANGFIETFAPDEFKKKWQSNVQDGSVAFGSAFHNWALSFPYMQEKGISFKDIIDAYEKEDWKILAKKAPLHEVVLGMIIKHHVNPITAQAYRIPKIWKGDLDTEIGKSLLNCDPKGPVAFIVTKIVIDKHAGEVSAGRLFSGTLKQGDEVWLNMGKKKVRLQQVSIYKGAQRTAFNEIPAGNIAGLVGLKDTFAGETISSEPMEPFEAIKHIFEPVITKSIEAKKASDLAKLIDVLKQVGKEDPSIKIEINEETGENLMHGMGELHLEIIENRIKSEKGLDVTTSEPIVVYRETVSKVSAEKEGKSPNKHNKFYMVVEPLEDSVYDAIKAGDLPEGRIKKKDTETIQKLVKLGYDAKEAKNVRQIYKGNMLIDNTRGIVHIGEVIEMIMDAYQQVIDAGPICREPCGKLKVRIMDMRLHEDAIHRGPAQVYPAIRESIKEAMADAKSHLLEPIQIVQIESPAEYLGELSALVQNKRGQLLNVDQEGEHITVKAKLPVAEMFGLASDLRSTTSGRGVYFIVDQMYEKLPETLQEKIRKQIRSRKGLSENA